MEFIFIAIFLAGSALVTARKLEYGILLTIICLPLYIIRFSLGPIPFTLLEGLLGILFFIWLVRCAREIRQSGIRIFIERHHLQEKPLKLLLSASLLFLLSATVSIVFSPQKINALGIWKAYFIEPFIFFLIVITTFRTEKHIRMACTAAFISGLSIAAVAIFQKFTGWNLIEPWFSERRVTSVYPYPNAVGLFLAPIIPISTGIIVLFLREKKQWRNIFFFTVSGILCTSMLVAIIFAKTEAALVALGVSLFFWALCANAATRKYALYVFISLSLLVVISPPVRFLISEKLFLKDWSGYVRRTLWDESVAMLKDHTVRGAGLAGFQETIKPYHKKQFIEIFLYPHNIILTFWSEIGMYGLVSFIALVGTTLYLLFKQRKKIYAQSILAAFGVIFIHGLVDVPYFKNDLSVFFWLLIALSVVGFMIHKHHKNEVSL